jgi:hypothetical protein
VSAKSKLEERFDHVSEENYKRIDKEVVDGIKKTDLLVWIDNLLDNPKKYLPFRPSERRDLRDLMGWQERLFVWLVRLTLFIFLFTYWNVHYPKCQQAQERITELENRLAQYETLTAQEK